MIALSVAIIGAGNIAGGYDRDKTAGDAGIYSHAGAYVADGGFALKTVFDTDQQKAGQFRDDWKVAAAAGGIEDVLENFHDVVSVCTPDATHFGIVRDLIGRKCCKTVFVEKPAALETAQIDELDRLARAAGINVVVNFQRRFDPVQLRVRGEIAAAPDKLLAVNCYYMKGLRHIGVTAVDTLVYLLGLPASVLAYSRVYNEEVREHTYEFVLFYDGFNATVKTTDSARHAYNYHIFEVDLLFTDRRATFVDNSRVLRHARKSGYAYSGVAMLDDKSPAYEETGYARSMLAAVNYVREVTTGRAAHTINTLADSCNNSLILDRIDESFRLSSSNLEFDGNLWKR